jgi:hypothetical protein
MPGTKYDRFFCDEFAKKLKDVEEIVAVVETLKEC